MKKGGTLYLIYVDGAKLRPNGFLRETYNQVHGPGARFILYAATIDPELVDGFFIFHKKEYFIVKTEKIRFTDDMTPDKLEKKFDHFWLKYAILDVGVWINKHLKHQSIAIVLTEDEEHEVGYELEALDEFLYDFYTELEFHRKLMKHKVFEKNIMNALKDIGLKKILSYVEKAYGDVMERGIPVTHLHLNEWGALRQTYGEVLIGGDKDEDSYI